MTECFPIFKGAIYNSTIANNTNFFASDLLPTNTPSTFLIYYVGTTASGQGGFYPYLQRTNGINTVIETIAGNAPGSFSTSTPIIFSVIVAPGDSINLKFIPGTGSAGVVTLIVLEVNAPSGIASLKQ